MYIPTSFSTRPSGSSLASDSIGTLKLSEFVREQSHDNDPLGSSRVSSQKQNREGVVEAQSGQYRATAEPRLGCDKDVTIWYQSQSLAGSILTRTSGP